MSTKIDDITIGKQTGTRLTLNQAHKYVQDDNYFDIDVQTGAGTVTIASTDAEIASDASGRNISGVIGTKTSSAPSSGYYLKVEATGNGSSAITTAGWLDQGSLGTATATGSFYFPVDTATASIIGTNTLTPSASVQGSNVSLSSVNNGISITATGGGSASASVNAFSSTAGYIPANTSIVSDIVNSTTEHATASAYISGVTLTTPESGTNSFSITLPNGDDDTVTLNFIVDSTGNWNIE